MDALIRRYLTNYLDQGNPSLYNLKKKELRGFVFSLKSQICGHDGCCQNVESKNILSLSLTHFHHSIPLLSTCQPPNAPTVCQEQTITGRSFF